MTIFKCKMCGGDLEIAEGMTIAECEYCGTKQTVPKAMEENLQNLFNRANTLRIKSEFDKAEKLYEKIIQADPTQSEAYWGLILCKYGIEYVDDPATFKKVPTCHRASFDSIIADDDYKSAIENADISQRAIYEAQAKEIDRIQKEILTLAQKEETYDVFICYKETDADGKRTQDSVIANDIYYQLTLEGFKVFYAAITLEGKLGSAYEPIIFAALNSAKVMLSIGTKPEYFNAVWVKNEWSRFLKIIKNDRSKLLIPCYRDMDAYELPEEFAHLQAQDMAKIGFINDLVRGIKKVVKKDEPTQATVVKETVLDGVNINIAPLLKRAFMFLEDGDWNSADEYCEKVLDNDPENAQAYIGKLMVELRVTQQSDLADCAEPFDRNNNYEKAIRFADADIASELRGYIATITDRNAKKAEEARKEALYLNAMDDYKSYDIVRLQEAITAFTSLNGYKDSEERVRMCQEKIDQIRLKEENDRIERERLAEEKRIAEEKARLERERQAEIDRADAEKRAKRNKKIALITTSIVCTIIAFIIILNTVIIPTAKYNNAIALMDAGKYTEAILAFEALDGYKDSVNKIEECNTAIRDGKYNAAITLMEDGNYTEAILLFEALGDYKDSSNKLAGCQEMNRRENIYIHAVNDMEAGLFVEAILIFETLDGYKDSAERIEACKAAILNGEREDTYLSAVALMAAGKYYEAKTVFETLRGYKDSAEKIQECNTAIFDGKYNEAVALMNAGKYTEAISLFETLEGYKDSAAKIDACKNAILDDQYSRALSLMNDGKYLEASSILEELNGYKNSASKLNECYEFRYNEAIELMRVGKYSFAISAFKSLNGYKDSAEKIEECNNIREEIYNHAIALMDAGQYDAAISKFETISGYKDSANKKQECFDGKYRDAIALMNARKYAEAIAIFKTLNGHKDSATKIQECNIAILDGKYREAIALMNAGKYTEAITAFETLNGYKNSADNILECKYNIAIALMDEGNYSEAITAFEALDGYKDSTDKANSAYEKYKVEKLKFAKPGDYIFFGSHEQDNNTSNGEEYVEWLVLEVKDGKALVISKYALDCQLYNTRYAAVTWETCTLRKWLNNDFINSTFSAAERAIIPAVTVSADENPEYSTSPGNATQDQVFLLSILEAKQYLNSYNKRQCKATDFAVANGACVDSGNCCLWWLRSPGNDQFSFAVVNSVGGIYTYGEPTFWEPVAVRPAMWIDLTL